MKKDTFKVGYPLSTLTNHVVYPVTPLSHSSLAKSALITMTAPTSSVSRDHILQRISTHTADNLSQTTESSSKTSPHSLL